MLREGGVDIHETVVYRTVQPESVPEVVLERLKDERVTLATFTSSSTARYFADLMESAGLCKPTREIPAASIGPTTTATLVELGYKVVAESDSENISIPGLVSSIVEYVNN